LDHSGETAIGSRPATAEFSARVRVGRLIEMRVGRLAHLADIDALKASAAAAMRLAGPPFVICADHRFASPVSTDLADPWSRAMRSVNRNLGRSAILLHPANTTFNLQIQRVVQCAGSDARRVFTDRKELLDWLDVRLTEAERAALRTFLDGQS
jgi:hypothetical protein